MAHLKSMQKCDIHLPDLFRIILCTAMFVCLSAGAGIAGEVSLKVGMYQNPPKVFMDGAGNPAGIFVDIIEEIADREGWEIEFIPGTWSEGLERLRRGAIDLMPDVAHTSSRAGWFVFHDEAVLSDWFQVYARAGSGISSLVDLQHKRVAVLEDSVQKEAFEELLLDFDFIIDIVPFPDYTSIFTRVEDGSIDAAISNRFHGTTFAADFGVEATAVIFHPTRLFFAAAPGTDTEILNLLDKNLRRMKQDPFSVYHASLQHWTSEQLAFELPSWIRGAVVLGSIFIAFAVLGNIVLKYQVNVRTRELNRANAEMEQRIEERTEELAAALEKARTADRVKSAFLAAMSHELRTPLNSIIGFTGILLQELPGPLNQEQHKQMRLVQKSARHLLSLINDVLDISKIEAGQLEIASETFEVRTAIEKVIDLMQPLATAKHLDLEYSIAPEAGLIHTDARRLEQILMNLLSNAIKFTDTGRIRVDCYLSEEGYVFEVSDTGIGIAPEHMPGLFQAFYQVDTGLARRHEGTGLGLSICKKLANLMGGNIEVESKSGSGSTFRIRLPQHMG